MKKINSDIIEECAINMMFEITQEERENTLREFESVLMQMELLGKIEGVDSVEPMTFPLDEIHTYLREDVAGPCLDVKEALSNAPSKLGNQIKLPKVVQ